MLNLCRLFLFYNSNLIFDFASSLAVVFGFRFCVLTFAIHCCVFFHCLLTVIAMGITLVHLNKADATDRNASQ